jgi:parvulin-like peptidyl-prolyl isomerase
MQLRSIVCGFAIGVALSVSAAGADVRVIEEIIAKVNGDIITRTDLERSRSQFVSELKARGTAGSAIEKALAEREKDILRDKIDQLLLIQKGRELGINVDGDVSKYIANIQLSTGIAEPEKFQAVIREQTGQSYEDWRSEIRNGYLTQRVIREQVGRQITIPRAELQKYYDEHKDEFVREERVFLREILISTEGKDEAGVAAAQKKALDLSARAKKGERFYELAQQNSDSVTKAQGGELGGFKRGELDPKIEAIVFMQDRGFVTDPIRVANGFLILRVDEKHKAGLAGFEEVENEIMEKLYMPKFQPQIREYLTKLRHEAFLELKPGYVDSAAAPGKDTKWSDPAELKPETVTKEEVASQSRRRRLFWLIPIPGTSTTAKPEVSSSK